MILKEVQVKKVACFIRNLSKFDKNIKIRLDELKFYEHDKICSVDLIKGLVVLPFHFDILN